MYVLYKTFVVINDNFFFPSFIIVITFASSPLYPQSISGEGNDDSKKKKHWNEYQNNYSFFLFLFFYICETYI